MDRRLTWQITAENQGKKIEEFLKSIGCSHHILTHLKRTECGIVLNGSWAYSSQRMTEGDVLELYFEEERDSSQILSVPIPIDILFEDEDLMILNKPYDMPIHPSVNNYDNTLANAVVYYFEQKQEPFVYRCINRLDRDTSGLLIIAKNMFSASLLYQMSAGRRISRTYLAVAEGLTPESGTISAPIARMPDSAIMHCADYEHGDPAVTHYRRIGQTSSDETALSLLEIRLETGRTHQIRVHFSSIGHPLAGDFLYNPESRTPIGRQALHSSTLDFIHPITGKPMHFHAPLPDDMQNLIDSAFSSQSGSLPLL